MKVTTRRRKRVYNSRYLKNYKLWEKKREKEKGKYNKNN